MDNEDFIELPVDSWTIVRSSKLTELEREADQAKAALAAQSGYAENEAQADLQAALIAQYDAIKAAVMNAPLVIRLDTHAMYTTILDAIAKHDPRKVAE